MLIQVTITGHAGEEPARNLPKARAAILAALESHLGEVYFAGERDHPKSKALRYLDFAGEFDGKVG